MSSRTGEIRARRRRAPDEVAELDGLVEYSADGEVDADAEGDAGGEREGGADADGVDEPVDVADAVADGVAVAEDDGVADAVTDAGVADGDDVAVDDTVDAPEAMGVTVADHEFAVGLAVADADAVVSSPVADSAEKYMHWLSEYVLHVGARYMPTGHIVLHAMQHLLPTHARSRVTEKEPNGHVRLARWYGGRDTPRYCVLAGAVATTETFPVLVVALMDTR